MSFTEYLTEDMSDPYFDLPGGAASWVDKRGRNNVTIKNIGKLFVLQIKGSLDDRDLKILTFEGLEHIAAIGKNKLEIKLRK